MYHVTMATDGACSGNPGPGGWGVTLELDMPTGTHTKDLFGGEPRTTNQAMELTAAIHGFEALKAPSMVTVYADSQYLIKAFTEGWIAQWQSRGWRTAKREAVAHQNLWARLLTAVAPHQVTWIWVKGHADHALNGRADALAQQGVASVRFPAEAPIPTIRETPFPSEMNMTDPAVRLSTIAALAAYYRTHPDADRDTELDLLIRC